MDGSQPAMITSDSLSPRARAFLVVLLFCSEGKGGLAGEKNVEILQMAIGGLNYRRPTSGGSEQGSIGRT